MIKSDKKSKSLIHAGWLVDGTGDPLKRDQLLEIEHGVIRSISPIDRQAPPPDMVVDLSRATLLPVLMDAHVHLALSGTIETDARRMQLQSSAEQVKVAIDRHLQRQWACGVGAVRDGGDRHGAVLQAKQRMRRRHADSPCVSATCWAWHGAGRYGRMLGRSPDPEISLRENMARCLGASDHIKLINSGINSLDDFGHTSAPHFSENDLAAVAQFARDNQLPLMVHANGTLAVRTAITAGCDSIEHGYFMGNDNLQRLAEKQITWVPTLAPMAALAQQCIVSARQADVARKTLEHQMNQIALAIQNDVPIALGTDAGSIGVDHGVSVRQEMALLMGCGMPLVRAVHSATVNVARLMKLNKRGALLKGHRADLIAVGSAPGELPDSLERIEAMHINGRWIDSAV